VDDYVYVSQNFQAISEVHVIGHMTPVASIPYSIRNRIETRLVYEHIKSEFVSRDFYELVQDPYLYELFSSEKTLNFGSDAACQYQFCYSKIFPTSSRSAPIVVDFYGEGLRFIYVFRLGEYYVPALVADDQAGRLYSYLDATEKSAAWIRRMAGQIVPILDQCRVISREDVDLPLTKSSAFNLQQSPGHYLEDEYPFIYKLSKYLKSDSSLNLYFTQGLGFRLWGSLAKKVRYEPSRAALFSDFNNANHWFIPNVTRNIGVETRDITLWELAQNGELQRTPPASIVGSDELWFAFGHRFIARDGIFFRLPPEKLEELSDALSHNLSEHYKKNIKCRPIIDFSVKDSDYEISVDETEQNYIAECTVRFGLCLLNTLRLPLEDKLSVLNKAQFGIYPYGSGCSVFASFFDDRPLFVHNHELGSIKTANDYISSQFKVLDNPAIFFSQSNLHVLKDSFRSEAEWTIDILGSASQITRTLIAEQPDRNL
jgi:hypothetical protein